VRDFLVDRWRITDSKVGVVGHGVDLPPPQDEKSRPGALRGDVSAGFIFTAGSLRPARGLEDAIRALKALSDRGCPLTLVVAGASVSGGGGYETRMRRLAADCGVDDQLLWIGQASTEEMSWCYHHCTCFLMTSRAEACPNVLLEAMAHGCLIVTVDRPPMTDMLGEPGLYYPLGNPPALADQLAAGVLLDASDRHRRQRSTSSRAARWTWSRTASETVAQLELATLRP